MPINNPNIYDLRKYQCEGVKFLFQNDAALLADEMGLGKTVQTAVAIDLLLTSKKIEKILIVCPKSLTNNWKEELDRWAPNVTSIIVSGSAEDRRYGYMLPVNTWITSYEQISRDISSTDNPLKFDLVILDEAQRIKNIDSKLAMSCRIIPREISWALSGTPIENKLEDLMSIFKFLKPDLISMLMDKNEIHSHIQPHYLRRLKSQVLGEMPPIIDQTYLLDLNPAQRTVYDKVYLHAKKRIKSSETSTAIEILGYLTKLKQICNFEPNSLDSCKLDAFRNILDMLSGSPFKILLFSQYVETLKILQREIPDYQSFLYHGSLNENERTAIIKKFNESNQSAILFLSLKAGGVGLNLQSATHVIMFDRWWNPAVENQAIMRGHRFGRTQPLHVIKFLVKDTIEKRIDDILNEKQDLFEKYIENAESAKMSAFTKEELFNLFSE